ncbi:Inhibitor of nuclear factor kappa-B kinase epsilon subunit homolog 1 [Caenorhabditis elegans]|uniref:Isoform d of Inhibitor of nuclear factor kappa-B kinase epsilon subunit homolog 1 n=1 Tax=Caenorhabditis elegans TaxID=6239 RepID=P32742-4|nr:Inhibitor of nuclear factor kappa-B kinase epsilon subunit homolog 1 [Caenorhabditis elegans]CAI46627.1 Inhibitor of nuclear factor kappa-B kinase epsilon subunit homolog 1 [Caenorhabditis elegans]|eukprot:NP_001022708.1 Inhibitor of nuclear factor kappa-B kinase epsilon subunit homolog 1 [Caenorhabditis elegans]
MAVSPHKTYPIVITHGEKYTLFNDESIGKGAYSEVYRGRTESGRLVAVKTACKKLEVAAIGIEIEILKKLKGASNIVQYFGSNHTKMAPGSVTSETISFAMEYASSSLEAEMRRPKNHRGLSSNALIDLVVDCSMALSALREHNIAHRDIKHMNILLFPGTPTRGRRSTHLFKLCDMGCSKSLSENSSHEMRTLVGTPNLLHPFLAHEMVDPLMAQNRHNWKTKSAYTSEQCDLWALGCTLYFCATGKFPFEHERNNKSLYHKAVVALTQNPDAIAMVLVQKGRDPGRRTDIFEFQPVTELPAKFTRYPKWLVSTMTCLLRSFFHEPSIEYYAKVADAMRNSKRRTFSSVDQMSIVEHTDMSNVPHLGFSIPSISKCLGYPEGTDILLLSNTSTHYLDSKQKSVDGLPDDLYLVVPQTSHVDMRKILARNIEFHEFDDMTDRKLSEIRIKKCYEGLSMLTEIDEYLALFDRVSTILSTQFSLLVQELSQFERVQTASRFAVYVDMASVPLMLFDEANPETKMISDQCIQQAKRAREELERHAKVSMDIEACAKQLSKDAEDLRLEDMDLPGICEEIESYVFYDKQAILSTQKYSQELVELCLKRRNNIMEQIFNSPDRINKSKLNKAMNLAASLSQLRSNYRKLQDMISECVDLLEKPFQEMKDTVNRYLQAQGCSRNTMQKSMHLLRPEFHESQIRIKKTTKSCRKLIDQLNIELDQLGFVRLGDILIKAESEQTLTRSEEIQETQVVSAESSPNKEQFPKPEQDSILTKKMERIFKKKRRENGNEGGDNDVCRICCENERQEKREKKRKSSGRRH